MAYRLVRGVREPEEASPEGRSEIAKDLPPRAPGDLVPRVG